MVELGRFVIEEKLPSFNDVISANRTNRYKGGAMKRKVQDSINKYILKARAEGTLKPITQPCIIFMGFVEKTRRRDVDNVQSGQKFILDSLVSMQILPNDSPKWVKQIYHTISYANENKVIVSMFSLPEGKQEWLYLAAWAGGNLKRLDTDGVLEIYN